MFINTFSDFVSLICIHFVTETTKLAIPLGCRD